MRELQRITLLVAVLFCAATLLAQGHQGPPSADQRLQHLATQLNLTEDQKTKIKPILDNEDSQLQALHQDTSMSRDDKMAKMKEIHSNTMSQIKPVLNADQQKQFDEMSAQAKQHMRGHHKQAPDQGTSQTPSQAPPQ